MKIVFNPTKDYNNEYAEMLVSYFRSREITVYSMKQLFSRLSYFTGVKLIHVNWFENMSSKSNGSLKLELYLRIGLLIFLRKMNFRIVWTMHNALPHDASGAYVKRRMMYYLSKYANAVVIHSHATLDVLATLNPKAVKKAQYIPHPNYAGIYGPIQAQSKTSEKLRLLFMGSVKPYKNIELLIEAVEGFEEEVTLLVAGRPYSDAYKASLLELVKSYPHIQLKLEFIENAEIPGLIAESDLLIFPYDIRSSLNSGSVILAFSYARSVICPRIGTILDLREPEDVFQYGYTTRDEHLAELKIQISKAIAAKKQDPSSLAALGQKLYQEMLSLNSIEKSGDALITLYKKLIN
jgi:beta-1,4-mannosyltransferase